MGCNLFEFDLKISESKFLFDNDVCEYLEKIVKAARRINAINILIRGESNPILREPLMKEKGQIYKWVKEQFDEANTIFAKYLSFKKIGRKWLFGKLKNF